MTDDAEAGLWVVAAVQSFSAHAVGSLLPAVYDAYARLFHPAYGDTGEVRWDAVAAANGRRAHSGMQWAGISGHWPFTQTRQPRIWDEEPETGSLPANQAQRLIAVLERFTTTPECFFAVWEGFGALAALPDGIARVEMMERAMYVFRGPLSDAASVSMQTGPFEQSPSLWWPVDRAWCVATDVDLMSTYIGAGRSCIDAVVADPGLETWPVNLDDSLTMESDELNSVPPYESRNQ